MTPMILKRSPWDRHAECIIRQDGAPDAEGHAQHYVPVRLVQDRVDVCPACQWIANYAAKKGRGELETTTSM